MATGPNAAQEEYWSVRGYTWIEFQERMDRQLDAFGSAAMAKLGPIDDKRVLDVGAGCGHTTLQLAENIGGGEVIGVDISGPMLDRARERAAQQIWGKTVPRIRFITADAQAGELGGPYDCVFSRFGVMFFADPIIAFRNLHDVTEPGGRLAFVCWQGVKHNPWMTVPNRAAMTVVEFPQRGPGAADPFAFGDPDHVRTILAESGWQDVDISPHVMDIALGGGGSVEEVTPLMIDLGPTKAALEGQSPQTRHQVEQVIAEALRPHERDGDVVLSGATWIVSARA